MRLRKEKTDYESIIVTLKGYQLATGGRPIKSLSDKKEMPEQIFLRTWGAAPKPLSPASIGKFAEKIEKGILMENKVRKLDRRKQKILDRIIEKLKETSNYIANYEKR
jgi:hypothetical protein